LDEARSGTGGKEMAQVFRVSQSKIKLWRHCRKAYHYKYIRKIEKRAPPRPLIFGKIAHEMIEAHINGEMPFKVLGEYEKTYSGMFKEQQEMYGDIIGDIRRVMSGYFQWWKKDPLRYLKHPKHRSKSELEFVVPLDDDLELEVVIDSIASTRDGRTWVVEHKTVSRFPEDEQFRYEDIQTSLYARVAAEVGFPNIVGVCWNYIRSKPPSIPELLKSGELTKRQNIDTTWDVYLTAILDNKLDPADYSEMRKLLKDREETFFRRVYLPVKEVIIENILSDTIMTAAEIQELHNEPSTHTRNLTQACNRCQYKSICEAELRNLDSRFILKNEYQPRKKKDEVEKTEGS
jgi:hypothetical protein